MKRSHSTPSKKSKRKSSSSTKRLLQEKIFLALLAERRLPAPVAEYRFHPVRRWRFDFAWPDHRVALEVEGGAFARGRHTRGAGFRADIEKYNAAATERWFVLRCLPEQLGTSSLVDTVQKMLIS